METISKEILLDKGYREWKPNHYQKLISNDSGKKYFINIINTDFSTMQSDLGQWWTPSVQLETDKGSVNFELVQWFNGSGKYSGRTIEEVEDYFESLFEFHNKPYYDLY